MPSDYGIINQWGLNRKVSVAGISLCEWVVDVGGRRLAHFRFSKGQPQEAAVGLHRCFAMYGTTGYQRKEHSDVSLHRS